MNGMGSDMGDHMALNDHKTPGFMDGGREATLFGTIVFIVGGIFLSQYDLAWISTFWKTIILFAVSFASSVFCMIAVGRARRKKREIEMQEYRNEQALIKERQLVQFQASKAWPKK